PVAVLVARIGEVPSEVLALLRRVLPELGAGLRRARDDDAAHAAVDARVWRGNDRVREAVAGKVRHQQHPVAEQAIGPFAVPFAGRPRGFARPYRRRSVLRRLVPELEARTSRDVGVTVTVDVERLAETEAELTATVGSGEAARHAPAGSGSRAR